MDDTSQRLEDAVQAARQTEEIVVRLQRLLDRTMTQISSTKRDIAETRSLLDLVNARAGWEIDQPLRNFADPFDVIPDGPTSAASG